MLIVPSGSWQFVNSPTRCLAVVLLGKIVSIFWFQAVLLRYPSGTVRSLTAALPILLLNMLLPWQLANCGCEGGIVVHATTVLGWLYNFKVRNLNSLTSLYAPVGHSAGWLLCQCSYKDRARYFSTKHRITSDGRVLNQVSLYNKLAQVVSAMHMHIQCAPWTVFLLIRLVQLASGSHSLSLASSLGASIFNILFKSLTAQTSRDISSCEHLIQLSPQSPMFCIQLKVVAFVCGRGSAYSKDLTFWQLFAALVTPASVDLSPGDHRPLVFH